MKAWPLLAVACIIATPTALGHAEPYQSDPAGGARLDVAPREVWVDFTEPVFRDGSWIRVVDQDGARVDNDNLAFSGSAARPRMTVSLQDVSDGAYRIQWQTYSKSDGHTIQGTIGFAVGGFAPPATTSDPEDAVDLAAAAARSVLYAGIALGIGAIAYAAAVRRTVLWDERRSLMAGATAAFVGTVALTWDTWQGTGLSLAGYAGSAGGRPFVWRVGIAGGLIAYTATWWRWRSPRSILVLGWVAFTWATASFGHVTRHGAWATGLEWLHLIAVATWIGGLWLFLRTLHTDPIPLGVRFSRMAQWAVAVVIATGLAITILLVGRLARDDPARLWSDSWMWFLAAKLGLVAVMLVLAAGNKYVFIQGDNMLARLIGRLRPDWTATGAARRRMLRKAVAVEMGLSALVLAAAGLLLSVSPPAEGLGLEAAGLERTADGEDFRALMQITPAPAVGQSHEVRFFIQHQDGEPLRNNTCGRDDCLRMRWTVDDDPGSLQERDLIPEGDGWWKVDEIIWSQAGNTTVTLAVQSAYVFLDELVFDPFVPS